MRRKVFQQTPYTAIHFLAKVTLQKNCKVLNKNKREKSQGLELLLYAYNS